MFFVLSKTADLLLTPIAWTILLVLAGLGVSARWPERKRLWRSLLALGPVVLYVFSLAPVANVLERIVEGDAPNTYSPSTDYDALVLLGGTVELLSTDPGGPPAFNESIERLLVTWDLLRRDRAPFVILSGGSMGRDPVKEADVLARQLEDWGIPAARIVIENKARNTRENAVFSKRIIDERGWKKILVITSAFHMRRAKECFNAVGLSVDTLPVDRRVYDSRRAAFNPMPRAQYLDESSDAIRELFGRVVYRVRGYAKKD